MTRDERRLVTNAMNTVARELARGREVRIPNFGVFKLSSVRVCLDHPMSEDYGYETHVQNKVHFRPFTLLKNTVRQRRRICPVKNSTRYGKATCYHPEGEGHDGPCLTYKGHPYPGQEK